MKTENTWNYYKKMVFKHKTIYIFSILSMLFLSCNHRSEVVLFISNNSFHKPKVDLTVRLNQEILVSGTFDVDSIQPSYYIKKLNLQPDTCHISVSSKEFNIVEDSTFVLERNKYIFIEFNFELKREADYEQERWKFNLAFPKEEYPDKRFIYDSVAVPPRIDIQMLDKKPVLM